MGKNNSMDTSSDKEAESHTRRHGHGLEREILREKMNFNSQQHK